jgi:hypothetical protein
MDSNYLFIIPAFLVGLLAGFQGIYGGYDEDPVRASLTLPGLLYLFTRGVVPAVVFLLLYGLHLMPQPVWFWSLVCGTAGTELILRTKIFIKEDRGVEGSTRQIMYGPLDLLQWYQNLFLKSIRRRLPTYRGEDILDRVKKCLADDLTFAEMCDKIKSKMYVYESEQTICTAIEQAVDKYLADYDAKVQAGAMTPRLDKALQYKLGYLIMNQPRVGERGLRLLIS